MNAISRPAAILSVALCLLALHTGPAAAAAASDPAGHWDGAIELPSSPLKLDVDLSRGDGGVWKGDISIPVQNVKDLALINIEVDVPAVAFEISVISGNPTFHGTLSADGAKITGDFTQGGAKLPFTLTRTAPPTESVTTDLAGYDEWVGTMIQAWKVPGLALAVVRRGEVAYAQGFGYRDVEGKLPVTPDTLFAIGSATKAFTTALLGTLVDEGKLDLDKPVRTYLPGFAMYDPKTSEMMTPRDLVTHRSGLPRHDALWYNNSTMTRAEVVSRLRYLEPNEALRAKWQYNNLMFLTAGYLAEQLTGQSWEAAVRDRLLTPLGMKRTNTSVLASQKDADFALPYDERGDKVTKIPFRNIDLIGPAGSINSSVREMAEWVKLHLGSGKVGDRQILQPATLADLHAPAMVIGVQPDRPDISSPSYALGWVEETYRGHLRLAHGGNIDGFSALVTFLPNDDLGLVVLTNKNGTGVPELLARHAIDRLLHLPAVDWNGDALAKREKGKDALKEAKAKKESVRRPGTHPAHKLEEYAGDYEHPGYGRLKVVKAGDHLEATYNGISSPLEHWHYEVWNATGKGSDPALEDTKFLFQGDVRGNVSAVAVALEPQVKDIVFSKLPDARLSDPAYLARYAGEYDLATQTVTISLAGSVLVARLPGQPDLHLVPTTGGEFVLKEASVITVAFLEDPRGLVTALVFNQPEGVFTAKKRK